MCVCVETNSIFRLWLCLIWARKMRISIREKHTHTHTCMSSVPDYVNRPLQNKILYFGISWMCRAAANKLCQTLPSARNKHKMSAFAPLIQFTDKFALWIPSSKPDQMWQWWKINQATALEWSKQIPPVSVWHKFCRITDAFWGSSKLMSYNSHG